MHDQSESNGYAAREYYSGSVAKNYSDHRRRSPAAQLKWSRESAAAVELLSTIHRGALVLDVPCGDGRFAPEVQDLGLRWFGADISIDMIAAGREREPAMSTGLGCLQADATMLPLVGGAADVALCARFANLIPLAVLEQSLNEIQRSVRGPIILEIRIARGGWFMSTVRTVRATVAGVRTRLRRTRSAEASAIARDPLRIHPEDEVQRLLARCGLDASRRVEVVTSKWPFRPDPLYFLFLEPG